MGKRTRTNFPQSSQKTMDAILRAAGFALSQEQSGLLWRYYNLIVKYNDACDLTRITRFEDFIIKHFVDSIIVGNLIELPDRMVDIGTGAGFPGIPLKIAKPDLSLILAEQRSKRVEFLRMAVKELALDGVDVYPHGVSEHSFFHVDGVITRALEHVSRTLARVSHFLPARSKVIFMKGPAAESEITPAQHAGYTLIEKKEYLLPRTAHRRTLLVYEKKEDSMRKTYRIFLRENENMEIVISSEANKRFKEWKKISTGEGIRDSKATLVSGRRLVKEIAAQRAGELVIFDGYAEDDRELNALIEKGVAQKNVYILKKSLYNELDVFGTGAPLFFTPVGELNQWDGGAVDGCTLLLPFQDPVNVGSAIRSAVAFGVPRIVVLREAANPYHPRSVRSSAGAVFRAPLFRGPSLQEAVELLSPQSLIALDARGVSLETYRFPDRFFLLPGMEGPGIPRDISCEKVSIPIENNVDSLNAAVATSIALYAWRFGKTSE